MRWQPHRASRSIGRTRGARSADPPRPAGRRWCSGGDRCRSRAGRGMSPRRPSTPFPPATNAAVAPTTTAAPISRNPSSLRFVVVRLVTTSDTGRHDQPDPHHGRSAVDDLGDEYPCRHDRRRHVPRCPGRDSADRQPAHQCHHRHRPQRKRRRRRRLPRGTRSPQRRPQSWRPGRRRGASSPSPMRRVRAQSGRAAPSRGRRARPCRRNGRRSPGTGRRAPRAP